MLENNISCIHITTIFLEMFFIYVSMLETRMDSNNTITSDILQIQGFSVSHSSPTLLPSCCSSSTSFVYTGLLQPQVWFSLTPDRDHHGVRPLRGHLPPTEVRLQCDQPTPPCGCPQVFASVWQKGCLICNITWHISCMFVCYSNVKALEIICMCSYFCLIDWCRIPII